MCVEIDPKDIKISDGTVVVWKMVQRQPDGTYTSYFTGTLRRDVKDARFHDVIFSRIPESNFNTILSKPGLLNRNGLCGFATKELAEGFIQEWSRNNPMWPQEEAVYIRKYTVPLNAEYAIGKIQYVEHCYVAGEGMPAMRAERLVPCE